MKLLIRIFRLLTLACVLSIPLWALIAIALIFTDYEIDGSGRRVFRGDVWFWE